MKELRGNYPDPSFLTRREFLQWMAALTALLSGEACTRQPLEKILPYSKPPENLIPGKPLFFATAASFQGFATGCLVESHMGRPTKIEGNPDHPASLGGTFAFHQAEILSLYDPDRSKVILKNGKISHWSIFIRELQEALQTQEEKKGAGLRILTESTTSPTLLSQFKSLSSKYSLSKWYSFEPINRDNVWEGSRLAFGRNVEARFDFAKAQVIVSLGADFLTRSPGSLRYAKDFISLRDQYSNKSRLYVAEAIPTLTGVAADHRWAVRASDLEDLALLFARALGLIAPEPTPRVLIHEKWVQAAARDLVRHRGKSLLLVGEELPPLVHHLGHALNALLGNIGRTVEYTNPVEVSPPLHLPSIFSLVQEIKAGEVECLVILGANPALTAPSDLEFVKEIENVPLRINLSRYVDETATLCHWHIPETHFLETWSDARAYDGSATILQPLIAPLYGGKSVHEVVGALLGNSQEKSYDIVRRYWSTQRQLWSKMENFEAFWERAVHDGLISGTRFKAVPVRVKPISETMPRVPPREQLEILFQPDPTIWDGRYANNPWLQELPKPITKLTWDNAALMSATTAGKFQVKNEDLVTLKLHGREIVAPVWILESAPDDSVTVSLGYGRKIAGRVGNEIGFNAYSLRTSQAFWFETGLEIEKTGNVYPLAVTQGHHEMDGRALVHPPHTEIPESQPTIAPLDPPADYEWGMAIDLNRCIGCNACVVACQAENNIPTVGKGEVLKGREMHWIRVDHYQRQVSNQLEESFQPVPCMHCETAPCETVCPVAATVHSDEGLNEMVYNRCVGTRYCSNNCPYKVRRFNFYRYADHETPQLKLLRNPDVTVRGRGVMEKCTYCVQRISEARIQAKKENRRIQDGEMVTACQAACPTQAIVFGDIKDPNTRVARLKGSPRNFSLLGELGTRPRTTYLIRVRNPNPELLAKDKNGRSA